MTSLSRHRIQLFGLLYILLLIIIFVFFNLHLMTTKSSVHSAVSKTRKEEFSKFPIASTPNPVLNLSQTLDCVLEAIATDSKPSHQSGLIGKNGLLDGDNPCCIKSVGKSLEELCTVNFNKALLDLQQKDPSIQLVSNKTISFVETEQVTSNGCSCNDYMYCRLVVVTGFSSNHFREAQGMIGSVQKHLPKTRLIVYDLGLKQDERNSVAQYCNVEFRKLDFSKYPQHVTTLTTYAFKPIIIEEVAQEYEIVMWGDTSVRIKIPIPDFMFRFLREFPYLPGPGSGFHSVSLTHDGMLKYLNLTRSRAELDRHPNEFQGTTFLLWINTFLKQNFLRYWIDCAYHSECISPKGATVFGCRFSGVTEGQYAGCHRFDQSAMNMILLREFGLGINKVLYHGVEVGKMLSIERYPVHDPQIRKCN